MPDEQCATRRHRRDRRRRNGVLPDVLPPVDRLRRVAVVLCRSSESDDGAGAPSRCSATASTVSRYGSGPGRAVPALPGRRPTSNATRSPSDCGRRPSDRTPAHRRSASNRTARRTSIAQPSAAQQVGADIRAKFSDNPTGVVHIVVAPRVRRILPRWPGTLTSCPESTASRASSDRQALSSTASRSAPAWRRWPVRTTRTSPCRPPPILTPSGRASNWTKFAPSTPRPDSYRRPRADP